MAAPVSCRGRDHLLRRGLKSSSGCRSGDLVGSRAEETCLEAVDVSDSCSWLLRGSIKQNPCCATDRGDAKMRSGAGRE